MTIHINDQKNLNFCNFKSNLPAIHYFNYFPFSTSVFRINYSAEYIIAFDCQCNTNSYNIVYLPFYTESTGPLVTSFLCKHFE